MDKSAMLKPKSDEGEQAARSASGPSGIDPAKSFSSGEEVGLFPCRTRATKSGG